MSDGTRIREALGTSLRARRVQAGMSLAAMARTSGLSAAHISDVERGLKDLSSDRLARACTALDVHPAELFADVSLALGAGEPVAAPPAPRQRLMRSAERLSPGALRTVAEFSAYLASKETDGPRQRVGFEF